MRGREDEDWYHGSLERIRDSREMLHLALALLEKDPRRSFELRFIRDLFVFTKCQEPEAVVCELRQKLDRKVVEVFQNGVKVCGAQGIEQRQRSSEIQGVFGCGVHDSGR